MHWKINISKSADKFLKKEKFNDEQLVIHLKRFLASLHGSEEHVNVRKMKGKWSGYHRIKIGKIRIIVKVDFGEHTIYVDRIDFRGSVYK